MENANNNDNSNVFLKKEITMGQLVGFAITFLTLCLTGWLNIRVELAEHASRIGNVEKTQPELQAQVEELQDKQDLNTIEILKAINDLKLDLKDKQDRK